MNSGVGIIVILLASLVSGYADDGVDETPEKTYSQEVKPHSPDCTITLPVIGSDTKGAFFDLYGVSCAMLDKKYESLGMTKTYIHSGDYETIDYELMRTRECEILED